MLESAANEPGGTKIHLQTTTHLLGIAPDEFVEIANSAFGGCPISRLLKAEITLDAKLG